MIIERIEIRSFGNLSGVTLTFGRGINVLVGNNESGKSTVAAFIRYMLYGFGTNHSPNDLPEREKRVSWQEKLADGEMDITLSDGRRLRIVRRTEAIPEGGRISYREDGSLINLDDGSVTGFRALPGESYFRVPEQLYTSTALFGQFSGARFSESEMENAMKNILFSGDERVSSERALKTMHEARNSLSHPSGVGGAIYELASKTDRMRTRLTQAMRSSARIHSTETELHSLRQKIASAEAERDRLAEIEGVYRGYLTIRAFDDLHEIESKHTALVEKRNALRRECGIDFVPDEAYLRELAVTEKVTDIAHKNYLRTLEKLESVKSAATVSPEAEELLRKTEEAGGRAAVDAQYDRLHRAVRRRYSFGWLLLVLSLLLGGAAAFLLRPLTLSPATSLSALAVLCILISSILFFRSGAAQDKALSAFCEHYGVISGADLLFRMNEADRIAREKAEAVESIRIAEENCEISRQNLEKLRHDLLALSRKWDKSYELGAPEDPILPLSDRVKTFFDEDKRLSGEIGEIRKQMLSQRAKLSGESEIAVRAQVPPGRREALEKVNFKTIQEGLVYYSNTCENLHAEYTELLGELNEHRRTAENPAMLRAELAALDERVADLRRRYRAYGIALDVIKNAEGRLRAEIAPRLSEFSGNLLEVATDGRYSALSVTDRLTMTYRDAEGNERQSPHFSGSTLELAYLSLRLALIDMLYKEPPPLCFDGILAQQDDERAKHVIKMLDTVAATGMQSILLTCHRRDAEIASAVSEGARCMTL